MSEIIFKSILKGDNFIYILWLKKKLLLNLSQKALFEVLDKLDGKTGNNMIYLYRNYKENFLKRNFLVLKNGILS